MTQEPTQAAPSTAVSRITLNGEATDTAATTLADLLTECGFTDVKVATALNGRFVPASARAAQLVREGDAIEVVSARQGG